jgi:hypothetical protein
MVWLASRYREIVRTVVDEASLRASENNRLYEAMVQAEKNYPSARIGDEEELRRLLQELKYKMVRKWADTRINAA